MVLRPPRVATNPSPGRGSRSISGGARRCHLTGSFCVAGVEALLVVHIRVEGLPPAPTAARPGRAASALPAAGPTKTGARSPSPAIGRLLLRGRPGGGVWRSLDQGVSWEALACPHTRSPWVCRAARCAGRPSASQLTPWSSERQTRRPARPLKQEAGRIAGDGEPRLRVLVGPPPGRGDAARPGRRRVGCAEDLRHVEWPTRAACSTPPAEASGGGDAASSSGYSIGILEQAEGVRRHSGWKRKDNAALSPPPQSPGEAAGSVAQSGP